MKRGFRALAVLAAVAAMSAGPAAFANCTDFGGFAIFQCADRAYFEPAPAGSGAVSAVFWQIGYGNEKINNATGAAGTGIGGGGTFNGNDQGTWPIDLADARIAIGSNTPPAGSLCLRSNNFANTGIDGCCDNPRDAALPVTKDSILNPLYQVNYVRNYGYDPNTHPSNDWVQDSPMAALLRESNGNYFAIAAQSTLVRTSVADARPGFYNFKGVDNGHANPFSAVNNIVPWQKTPGYKAPGDIVGLVRSVSTPTIIGPHNVTLGWDDATIYQDASATRTSSNGTVTGAGFAGMGSAQVGPLVRYVAETQTIVNPNDPIGSLNPNGWTAAGTFHNPTNSAVIVVNADSCVRLHTYFGHEPDTSSQNTATCRLGQCGDLGYDVTSPASCIGGPLVSETPIGLEAIRERAGAVTIRWKAAAELTTSSYRIEAVTKKGVTVLGTVPATATGSGASASYKFSASVTQLKGTRTIQVVALPSGAKQSAQIQ